MQILIDGCEPAFIYKKTQNNLSYIDMTFNGCPNVPSFSALDDYLVSAVFKGLSDIESSEDQSVVNYVRLVEAVVSHIKYQSFPFSKLFGYIFQSRVNIQAFSVNYLFFMIAHLFPPPVTPFFYSFYQHESIFIFHHRLHFASM